MRVLGLALAAACTPAPRPTANAVGAPDLAALRALLAPHADVRFDASANARGCPDDQSLGEYVARLVSYGGQGDQPGDTHWLKGGCGAFTAQIGPIDPPASADHWYCTIDAYTSDPTGESPWHYELRLRVRKSDGAPDLTTLGCPGMP
jgi:hypothetical protein